MILLNPRRVIAGCLLVAALGFGGAAQAADFKVIVHSSNPVSGIDRAQLSRIFMGKTSRWDHGVKVEPVDNASTDLRGSFSKAAHGRSASAIKSYWQKQIFSGRGVPPPVLGSDSDVIAYVKSNPGAVGYVSAGAASTGVKVIEVR